MIATLGDARAVMRSLPAQRQSNDTWLYAGGLLLEAAMSSSGPIGETIANLRRALKAEGLIYAHGGQRGKWSTPRNGGIVALALQHPRPPSVYLCGSTPPSGVGLEGSLLATLIVSTVAVVVAVCAVAIWIDARQVARTP
jgi:hypothetical protein